MYRYIHTQYTYSSIVQNIDYLQMGRGGRGPLGEEAGIGPLLGPMEFGLWVLGITLGTLGRGFSGPTLLEEEGVEGRSFFGR